MATQPLPLTLLCHPAYGAKVSFLIGTPVMSLSSKSFSVYILSQHGLNSKLSQASGRGCRAWGWRERTPVKVSGHTMFGRSIKLVVSPVATCFPLGYSTSSLRGFAWQ